MTSWMVPRPETLMETPFSSNKCGYSSSALFVCLFVTDLAAHGDAVDTGFSKGLYVERDPGDGDSDCACPVWTKSPKYLPRYQYIVPSMRGGGLATKVAHCSACRRSASWAWSWAQADQVSPQIFIASPRHSSTPHAPLLRQRTWSPWQLSPWPGMFSSSPNSSADSSRTHPRSTHRRRASPQMTSISKTFVSSLVLLAPSYSQCLRTRVHHQISEIVLPLARRTAMTCSPS